MAKTPQNKDALNRLRKALAIYLRVLPSLELKRQQLALRLVTLAGQLAQIERDAAAQADGIAAQLPALADPALDLAHWAEIGAVHIGRESLLGVDLPVLESVATQVRTRTLLGTPAWLERLERALSSAVERRLAAATGAAQQRRLDAALRETLQRVNLFEKRLIPQARSGIRRIEIALDDAARSAVVGAKLARRRHARRSEQSPS